MAKLDLKEAENSRLELTTAQQLSIKGLYKQLIKKVDKELEKLSKSELISAVVKRQQLKSLQKGLKKGLASIGKDVSFLIRQSMTSVVKGVVKSNKKFLGKIGLPRLLVTEAFSNLPTDIVESVASGQVYEGKWSLNKAIWKDVAKKQGDINKIVSEGIALNKSTYDIAKDLETYVDPDAAKPWDWNKVYPGTAKQIDYNAQRLARTMVSHAYQQAFDATVDPNPFVEGVQWNTAHSHNRVCEVCKKRASEDAYGMGKGIYPKGKEPLDHPNGMCYLTAVIPDSLEDIAKQIKAWTNGKENKQLDKFAEAIRPGWNTKQ